MPFQLIAIRRGALMHYTYVLLSEQDKMLYTGTTRDLGARVRDHANGRVRSTSYRRPLQLIYYEACLSPDDAFRRERFLKTGKGKRYLRNRLASFLGPFLRTDLASIGDNKSRSTVLERDKLERH